MLVEERKESEEDWLVFTFQKGVGICVLAVGVGDGTDELNAVLTVNPTIKDRIAKLVRKSEPRKRQRKIDIQRDCVDGGKVFR